LPIAFTAFLSTFDVIPCELLDACVISLLKGTLSAIMYTFATILAKRLREFFFYNYISRIFSKPMDSF
jgi:hypothetical protein